MGSRRQRVCLSGGAKREYIYNSTTLIHHLSATDTRVCQGEAWHTTSQRKLLQANRLKWKRIHTRVPPRRVSSRCPKCYVNMSSPRCQAAAPPVIAMGALVHNHSPVTFTHLAQRSIYRHPTLSYRHCNILLFIIISSRVIYCCLKREMENIVKYQYD